MGNPTPSQTKKKRGCLYWGCVIAGIGGGLALIVALVAFLWIRRAIDRSTDTKLLPVPVAKPALAEAKAAQDGLLGLVLALQTQKAHTAAFSGADLNALVATLPQCQEARGKVFFTIEDDRLLADTSVPLDQIPALKGRFLNQGRVEIEVRFADGRLSLRPRSVQVKGQPLPGVVMSKLRNVNLAQGWSEREDVRRFLDQIEALNVRDGKLVIRTKGK